MAYQYETSPRKLQPEYDEPTRKKKIDKKVQNQKATSKKKVVKRKLKPNVKMVLYVIIVFAVLLTISYRNSQITIKFNKKEELKKNLSAIQKENEQLKVSIEQSLNLNNVEQSAKDLLGMQKLDNSQKKYINIEKKDYIQPALEEVIVSEEKNWFESIISKIFGK